MEFDLEKVFKRCYRLNPKICIILANGEFPKTQYLLEILGQADCIICCDGAVIKYLEDIKLEPTYIVGDCDSLSDEIKYKYSDKIKYIKDQNTNDLTKAINFAVDHLKLSNIIILGATGLREDHNLANISLLVEYSKKTKDIIMLSDYGFFSVSESSATILSIPGQQISLFAIRSDTKVSTSGLKWNLDNYLLDAWYKGTLNEALNDHFIVKSNYPILIYRSFEIKHPVFTD